MKTIRYILIPLLLTTLTAKAQTGQSILKESAMEYMLQKPAVAKRFASKHFLDRFFLEAGMGVNNTLRRNTTAYMDWAHFGLDANVAVGDWITPEHGVRLSFGGHIFRRTGIANKAKTFGISADYLMNLTAIGSRVHNVQSPIEFIGVAGLDLQRSHMDGTAKWAHGVHLGLRGQANLSYYTYLYIEPRVSVFDDNLLHRDSRLGWRPTVSIQAGVGYRMNPGYRENTAEWKSSRNLLSRTFVSFGAGPSMILNGNREVWKEQQGARVYGSLGKWFDPYSAIRLNAGLVEYNQPGANSRHIKGGYLGVDYMLNMHNVFGGYNPNRRFYINGVAGASYSYLQSGKGKKWIPGAGFGLQANVGLGKVSSLFIEPRVDFYPNTYGANAYTSKNLDIAASLLAGITLEQTWEMENIRERNADFKNTAWYDHVFLEGSVGGMFPIRSYSLHNVSSSVSPTARVGLGKWFTPLSGVRLRAEANHAKWDKNKSSAFVNLGADYLWNISNATRGYRDDSHLELIGVVGLDAASYRKKDKLYIGANLGLKGLWNVSPQVSLFLEPTIYAYDNAFLPGTTASSFKIDLLAAMRAGMQFNIQANEAHETAWYERDDQRTFYTLSAGGVMSAIGFRSHQNMGATARAGFGRWFSPVSAWRVSAGTQAMRHTGGKRVQYSGKLYAGADYITDFTAASLGENPDRVMSVRSLFGANLALRYKGGKSTFCPDVHAGFQVAAALGKGWEVYAEPQLAYQLEADMDDKAERLLPSLQFGMNYAFRRGDRVADNSEAKRFVEVSLGTGAYSGTVTTASPLGRKFTFSYGAAYGEKIGKHSAYRVGINRTLVHKRSKNAEGSQLTQLHADYMQNLLPHDDGKFHLRAAAGLSINAHALPDKTRWAPGMNLSTQASYNVAPSVEVYVEPMVTMMGKTITGRTSHPMEGEGKLMFGARMNF